MMQSIYEESKDFLHRVPLKFFYCSTIFKINKNKVIEKNYFRGLKFRKKLKSRDLNLFIIINSLTFQ